MMFRQLMAMTLCVALVSAGCASGGGPRVSSDPTAPSMDRAVLSEFAQRIPAGSKVRIERNNGGTLRGTLLKTGADALTVQLNTRIPEPPVEVPFSSVTRLTVDNGGSSVGKNIAIGVASGVDAFFGIIGLLTLIYGD